MTYDFNGTAVEVRKGEVAFVVTSPVNDCASVFRDVRKFEHELQKGRWDEANVYRITAEKVEQVQ